MFLENVLFQHAREQNHPILKSSFLIVIFILGVTFWTLFFNTGALSLVAYDWVKEDAYLNTLRTALKNGVIPWIWSKPFYHGTQYFLANPEVIFTPDILLLPWVSNTFFIIIHVVIMYSCGFVGSVLIARKLNLTMISILIFWLVFNFNGYIISHIAVGHLQWTGYFLLPFFFIIFSSFLSGYKNDTSLKHSFIFKMGLLLGILIMNGSVHIAIFCSMFMITTLLWSRLMLANIASALAIGLFIGLGRLLPAAIWFPKKSDFISGYPDLGILINALTSVHNHEFKYWGTFGTLGWWEYNIFVGFVGSFVLAFGLVVV